MNYKVLIVEDEIEIREILSKYLENEGYEVIGASNGFEGLALFASINPDIIVLDVMMAGINGFEVLKEIRFVSDVPIVMLTAKKDEIDRLNGFDLGVDDYVIKPFSPRELVKRVNVIIKRVYKFNHQDDEVSIGALTLNNKKQTLYCEGENIPITSKEFRLLAVFFNNQGQLLSREQLIEDAFGVDYDGFDRNIDSYIKKIRQKIEKDSRNPIYLKTKYGAGYIFGGDLNDT